ncbi:MAG: 30S ribosomal protein S4, partial [Candidatus Altiarchaeota archaeon]|nr:30S ribosomal protein S4 [Candidatus Altiarchaeota archaeon]
MKRQRKRFTRPFKRWDKTRLDAESKIMKTYGLKNKKELWRAEETIRKFRSRARRLFTDEAGRTELFGKLTKLGLLQNDATLDDVLGLRVEAILERRLQTLVFRKGLGNTQSQSRQLISHRHIKVGDAILDIPGHIVTIGEEPGIAYSNGSPVNDASHPIRAVAKKEAEEKPKEATKKPEVPQKKEETKKTKDKPKKEEVKKTEEKIKVEVAETEKPEVKKEEKIKVEVTETEKPEVKKEEKTKVEVTETEKPEVKKEEKIKVEVTETEKPKE